MAKATEHATVTVSIVPDLAGFKTSLQGEVVDAGIRAGWVALEKRIGIEFRAQSRMLAFDVALWDGYLDGRFPERW